MPLADRCPRGLTLRKIDMSTDPKEAATQQIIADFDYLAQLMLAGAMPPLPQRPCDATPSALP